VSDGDPTIGGDPRPGAALTADEGRWSGAGPIALQHQWLRCDASGAACEAIPGATGTTYTPTADDAGRTLRVEVTATNGDGRRTARSAATAPVAAPADDLSTIGGSLVSGDSCQRIVAGTGVKRANARGIGTVKILLRASAYVAPSNPLRLSTNALRTKLKGVRYALDGKTLGQPKRKPYWFDVKPSALNASAVDVHKLAVTLLPARGKAATFTFDVRTKPCDNLLSVLQWKTAKGTGLRLRVDSREAVGDVRFAVPAAMLPKSRDAGKGIGSVRVFLKGGERRPYKLTMSKAKGGVLLDGEGRPRVELVPGGAVVSNLPAGVGIVELTLYTQKATSPRALLTRGRKASLSAFTAIGGQSVKLTATLLGKGR
jgi:hypothetical protein